MQRLPLFDNQLVSSRCDGIIGVYWLTKVQWRHQSALATHRWWWEVLWTQQHNDRGNKLARRLRELWLQPAQISYGGRLFFLEYKGDFRFFGLCQPMSKSPRPFTWLQDNNESLRVPIDWRYLDRDLPCKRHLRSLILLDWKNWGRVLSIQCNDQCFWEIFSRRSCQWH